MTHRMPARCSAAASRVALLVLALVFATPLAALARPLRVLVTNDDGVAAQGISVLVARLAANRALDVHVIAPMENQSGTGDRVTTGPITVVSSMTAAGFPARSVNGFPADTVLFGVLQGLDERPDLVVSGINLGQNVAEVVNISGTVGAGLTAARLGIPAFAVSQGLGSGLTYDDAAAYTAELVERYRTTFSLRRLLRPPPGRKNARVLNINFPTCTSGTLRGVRAVVLGRAQQIVAYQPAPGGQGVWQPVVQNTPIGSNDCTSVFVNPKTDLEAMNNGFASVTPLNADLTNDGILQMLDRFVEQ